MKIIIAPIAAIATCCLIAAGALLGPGFASAAPADDRGRDPGDGVDVLVLLEGAPGSARQAQGHLDTFLAVAAKSNGWPIVTSKYLTSRKKGLRYLASHTPTFGILSLPAFLATTKAHPATVIGEVEATSIGGKKYFVISKTAGSLADCKGKTLASNHLKRAVFIDKVVLGSEASLSDFNVVDTKRPVKTLKSVIKGEAACALVDDHQKAALAGLDGGADVKAIWESAALPPTVVVAYPSASQPISDTFRASLAGLCQGDGADACKNVGITALKPSTAARYKAVLDAYYQ